MPDILPNIVTDILSVFWNPQKRVFGVWIGLSSILAVFWLWHHNRSARGLFTRRSLWSPSLKADYKLFLASRLIGMFGLVHLGAQISLAPMVFFWLSDLGGMEPGASLGLSAAALSIIFTLTWFLLDDASKYLVHRLLHRWPVLWAFHQVHHSATRMTPITVYRTHPVENVLFFTRGVVVQGIVIGLFFWAFGGGIDLYTLFGANAFAVLFNLTGSNLRHSHIPVSFGRVEKWFLSPAQHQLHHSIDPIHYDCNFGTVFSLWDRLGGSFKYGSSSQKLVYGLARGERFATHNIQTLLLTPFYRATAALLQTGTRIMSRVSSLPLALKGLAALLVLTVLALPGLVRAAEEEPVLNIYSHRQPFLINPFVEAFEKETGIKVNIVYASKGLAQRLQAEGKHSPADLVLTVDIARIAVYADKGLLAPVQSDILDKNVPPHLRAADNSWFAMSKRARVVAIAKGVVDPADISRIEDLADPKWKGRICSRPGSHVYNRALIASLIAANGEEAALDWAKGVVGNLARRPQGNDRAQVKAIFEGVCDIAVINNYYYGKLKFSEKKDQRAWADAIEVVFTNQANGERGNHVNISGGGIAKYAPHPENAKKFLEFLTGATAQGLYGKINFEYPVNPAIDASDELKSWGDFREDSLPISRIADLAPDAQRIIDQAGW